MDIRLGERHILHSDSFQFWLSVEVQSESGKTYERRCTGYHKDFRGAVEDFIDRKVKGSDSVKIKALAQEVEDLKTEVRSWPAFLEKGGADD